MIVTKSYIIKIKLYLLHNSFKIDFFNGLGWDNRKIILINMAEVYLVQMRQIPHCYSNTFLEVGWGKKS